jgi:spermidine synthase
MKLSHSIDALPPDDKKAEQSRMLPATIRLLVLIMLGSSMIVAMLPVAVNVRTASSEIVADGGARIGSWSLSLLVSAGLLICVSIGATITFQRALKILAPFLEADSLDQAYFLDTLNSDYVDLAIVLSAALSLFLELALIRWHSSVLEFLSFYKNYSLLACFAGLGLGYALASRSRIPLLLVIPLLAWQFLFMMIIRLVPGPFRVIPFREQLSMGIKSGTDVTRIVMLYLLLIVLFLMTALTFLPVGQLCGRLMERRSKLRSYGLNLLGSVVGVLLMLGASFLWAPPLVWFALCFILILLLTERRTSALLTGFLCAVICVIILAWWPVDRVWNRLYSPYQLLEIGTNPETGLTAVRAAGLYYQRVHDLSRRDLSPKFSRVRDYYDFAYKLRKHLDDVAIVGAGTGNDVAAALRAGAVRVDAVEIDPAIMLIGEEDHPERPYSNPRTRVINDDARSFLRRTDRRYDLIAYGLLDSHTLLTQGSSVRLDSFVYTVEGFQEARNRLKPDGMISLSYSILSPALGRKIYLMLQKVFDGRPPAVVTADYDGAVIFVESNDPTWNASTALANEAGFKDQAGIYSDPSLKVDLSTDDWPFFYMPQRVYPASYLVMIGLIVLLSIGFAGNFLRTSPSSSDSSFFFLGAGFMLIETKNITEMGLTFGNTWQVIGIVITAILVMAFFGNYAVDRLHIRRPQLSFLFLWATLSLGWFVSKSGGFASTPLGRVETAILLASPFLFSGIIFSSLLSSSTGQISGAMAMNLLGAICGGLVEYNSMYFGFRMLYFIAVGCYGAAFVLNYVSSRRVGRLAVMPARTV